LTRKQTSSAKAYKGSCHGDRVLGEAAVDLAAAPANAICSFYTKAGAPFPKSAIHRGTLHIGGTSRWGVIVKPTASVCSPAMMHCWTISSAAPVCTTCLADTAAADGSAAHTSRSLGGDIDCINLASLDDAT